MNENILAFENIKILRKKITTNDVFMKTEKIKKFFLNSIKFFLQEKRTKLSHYQQQKDQPTHCRPVSTLQSPPDPSPKISGR